jgi:putative SbcD/Mre11-related phosphoesterase
MDLEPVPDVPALAMRGSKRWLCVADLHLGIEVQLRHAGFNIPSQAPKMLSSLETLTAFADNLLILGDLKHRIPSVSYREDREIPPILDKLMDCYKEVVIVAGNHDGGLETILPPGVRAVSGAGLRVENVGAFHGHIWPSKEVMQSDMLVMAHVHPSVVLVDSLGAKSNEKCWLKGKLKSKTVLERYDHCPRELIIVPAFNPLLTGTPVNSTTGSKFGPLFRNDLVDSRNLEAYLLDGTNLGVPTRVKMRAWPERNDI